VKENRKARAAVRPVHAFRRCFRCLLLFILLLVSAGYYLNAVGLPESVKDRIVRELGARGVHVKVARVRWVFLEGVVMDDLRYFAGPLDPEPLVRAEEASVGFRPSAWFRGRHGINGLSIRNASLGPGGVISGIQAAVRLEDQGLRITGLSAEYNGLNLSGGGYVARPAENMRGALVQAWQKLFPRKKNKDKSLWLPDLLAELRAVRFRPGSSAQITLLLHPDDLQANDIAIDARGSGLTARGVTLDAWRMQASLRKGRITLPRLVAGRGGELMRISGFLDLADGSAACKLYSDLPPYILLALAPVAARQALDKSGISIGESLAFSAEAGPGPIHELLNAFHGSLAVKEARLKDLPVAACSLDFTRGREMIVITNLQAEIGQGAGAGPMSGHFSYDLESMRFGGQMKTGFDPNWLCPLVSSNKARIISGLHFRSSPPQVSFTFAGQRGEAGEPLSVKGSVKGKDFSFRGSYFTSADCRLVMTNSVLNLDPLTVKRDKTAGKGRISFDFRNDIVDVDMESTYDPKATVRMMGPTLERLSRPFSFNGYSHITARGSIDYHSLTNMNLDAQVVASNMAYRGVAAERCDFVFVAKENRFEIKNARGRLYGGEFELSRALIESLADSPLWHYDLACSMKGVDFGKLMQAYRRLGEDHPYEGKLDFSLSLAGETGDQFYPRMLGRSSVRITESPLLRVPLFTGLAKMLSVMYPSFGIVSQNDLTADFKIGGNSIRTQNARLLGHIISISGDGRYNFNNSLDFKVRVRMLREGKLAAVLNWVTFPVTKLLEFHLSGPLEQPVWRPDNLPKELFNLLKSVIPGVGVDEKR